MGRRPIYRPGTAARSAASLLLVAVVLATSWNPANAPSVSSSLPSESVDISKGWRFRTDPGDVGLRENWQDPRYDDRNWVQIDVGRSWDEQGFPNYSGYGWYRRLITIPAGWRGLPLYLWLSGIDDEADVFLEGKLLAHFGDQASNQSAHRGQFPIDIASLAKPGARLLVAVRVNNWGGDGGVKSLPAAIATSNAELYSDFWFVKHSFNRDPNLPWPYWLKENKGEVSQVGSAWSMVGMEGSLTKGLIGLDGTVMPSQVGIAVTPWIFDKISAYLHAPQPADITASLALGYLPVPSTEWRMPGLVVSSTLFVGDPFATGSGKSSSHEDPATGGEVAFYSITATNIGSDVRDLSLFLATHPYGAAGRLSALHSLGFDGEALDVNGGVGLVPDRKPDGFGATPSAGGNIGLYARDGKLPPDQIAKDRRGLASGALLYGLKLDPGESQRLTFKLPVSPKADRRWVDRLRALDFDSEHEKTLQQWRSRLDNIQLSLPDSNYRDAFYASIAYLDLARNGDLILPGPLVHRRFWYRDAAYLTTAMLRTGRIEDVRPLLARIQAGQLPSGEFPPILRLDGQPDDPNKHEWDAQGQGIFTLVSYYRWTRDASWLRSAYPTIRRAVLFLQKLRNSNVRPDLEGSPAYGILPPSESAEDLGPATWHHYWDDFWGIVGLQEAAYAAEELGEIADVSWISDEERQLRAAVVASIRAVQQAKGIDYVPNGPEDTDSSAMARGTTAALWPVKAFDPRDRLFLRSFDVYYDRFVAPTDGGYVHYAQHFWPFGGLELAHVYLLQGKFDRVQKILDWTLEHQSFPGLYAWADNMLRSNNRLAGGDMPHAWVAAEYVLLLRDMLLREDGERLVIGSYLPRSWLTDGQRIDIAGFPTLFGTAGFRMESHEADGFWELSLVQGAEPPSGYFWSLPPGFIVERVIMDGEEWHDFDPKGISFPSRARNVRAYGQFS